MTMNDARGSVLVFSKPPRPGVAKRRLIPVLGEEGAAALYRQLLEKTLDTATAAGVGAVELWCSDSSDTAMRALARERRVKLQQQSGADLGERMAAAFSATLARSPFAILIGCDCPALQPADLRRTAGWLASGAQAVIGPSRDGGYYLVGLRRPVLGLFTDMPWGTGEVLAETRARLRRAVLTWHELPEYTDIDRPEDLALLPPDIEWAQPEAN